jgi:hypothetical protein
MKEQTHAGDVYTLKGAEGEILKKLRQTTINKLDGVSKREDRRHFYMKNM